MMNYRYTYRDCTEVRTRRRNRRLRIIAVATWLAVIAILLAWLVIR